MVARVLCVQVCLTRSAVCCRRVVCLMSPWVEWYPIPVCRWLSRVSTSAGVTDMMMHTMERYFTKDDDMDFTTDLAEAALRSIKNAVFPVLKNPEGTAEKGIQAMERFYHAIGMPINIKELIGRDITDEEIKEMTRKCSRDNTITCGALKVLQAPDMEAIYKKARG